jgi:hypothetical protein
VTGRRLLHRGILIQKMVSNEGLLIVLKWQLNFDGDHKVAVIEQPTSCD